MALSDPNSGGVTLDPGDLDPDRHTVEAMSQASTPMYVRTNSFATICWEEHAQTEGLQVTPGERLSWSSGLFHFVVLQGQLTYLQVTPGESLASSPEIVHFVTPVEICPSKSQ